MLKKRIAALVVAPVLALGGIVASAGVASATSLSGLGAPPVNNTNCWERQGFGFTEVNCQWGAPYNYAHSLYQGWINAGTVKLYGSYWPTDAAQPTGANAWHNDWSATFMDVDVNTTAAFDYLSVAYANNRNTYTSPGDPHRIMLCGGRVNGCI